LCWIIYHLGADFISESDFILDLSKGCCYFSFLPSAKIYFHNREILCALQGLQSRQQHQLNYLLSQFPDVMTDKVGCTSVVKCELSVSGKPIAQRPYPTSPTKRAIIKENVQNLLRLGFIRASKSE